MYRYNIYLGYERKTGGFPTLGEIEYNYPLNKGDSVILSKGLFDAISNIGDVESITPFKYRQTYIVAAVHHWIDNPTIIADIYLVMDEDFKK